MKRIYMLLFIGLGYFCPNLNAQSVTVEGVVKDSLNQPLELANVIAINKNSKGIASYGITDSDGRYRLSLKIDSLYTLRVSYLGFETWEKEIQPKSKEKITQDIVLKAAANELEGVELVQELPISVSGDTIIYKADAFTDGKEKKLEQVLEKLPGFEVGEDGQVKVQGKSVSKVLVEGKEFFDGDTKMATKNLPANAVDKVELLRNFNDVSPLKGLQSDDRIALNIKLKEGKKNLWFGDVAAGAGPDDRYTSKANLFYYSPKTSVNFIGGANNIGEQSFTLQDYFRFSGGLKNLGRRSGSSFQINSDDAGLAFLQNNQARSIESALGALNFSYNPNKKINFSGFAIASNTKTDLISNSFRTYIREQGNNEENLASETEQDNTSGLLKLSSTYTPHAGLHLAYDGYLKTASLNQNGLSNSDFGNVNNVIGSTVARQPFSIEQLLEGFYAQNDKNVWSFEASYKYKKQDPTYDLSTSQVPFLAALDLNGESPFGLFQDQLIFTNSFDAVVNYYRILNKTNHINFSIGTNSNHQGLQSSIDERFSNGTSTPLTNPGLTNDVSYDFLDLYAGIRYKTKLGKLTLSPGFTVHSYQTANTQLGVETELDKTLFLPSLNAKYDIRGSESISLTYNTQAEFTDIQNLSQGTIIRSYNSLFLGNPQLENAWYQTFNLSYYNFNMFNFTNINANLNYQRKKDDIQNILTYQNLDRNYTPINIDAANENLSGRGSYEKRLSFMKIRGEANLTYAKYNNFIDGAVNENTSFVQNYKTSIDTNFKEWPNVEVGFEKIINDYQSSSGSSTFVTNRPFVNFEAYFLKGFSLIADYQYNDYKNRNGSTQSTYDFLNASLYYQKEDSHWEFKISGLNLLNTTSIRRDSFSNNLISTFEYLVQPRYVVLGVKYEL
ncbi:carboxypeptidase regulatory-like domain-containing protein [Spongiimicrobium salis]|uniref:carboxypeptidase regulatory-like domain-containing protein n=1 Tax=Spongiimicrobium salis TaxID=1667022 RepID=UPI00374DBDC6